MFMRVLIIVFGLFFLASCSTPKESQELVTQEKETQISYLIDVLEFKNKMNAANVVILDVRTTQEVAEGVIGSPLFINFSETDFKEQLIALDKTKTYLVYCKSGGRSGQTKSFMDANGFGEVYDLQGGITAWKAAGLPVD